MVSQQAPCFTSNDEEMPDKPFITLQIELFSAARAFERRVFEQAFQITIKLRALGESESAVMFENVRGAE